MLRGNRTLSIAGLSVLHPSISNLFTKSLLSRITCSRPPKGKNFKNKIIILFFMLLFFGANMAAQAQLESKVTTMDIVPAVPTATTSFMASFTITGYPGEYVTAIRMAVMDLSNNVIKVPWGPYYNRDMSGGDIGTGAPIIDYSGNYKVAMQYSQNSGASWSDFNGSASASNPTYITVSEGVVFQNWTISPNPGIVGQALFVRAEARNMGGSNIWFDYMILELLNPSGVVAYADTMGNVTVGGGQTYYHEDTFYPSTTGNHTVRLRGNTISDLWITYSEQSVFIGQNDLVANFTGDPTYGAIPLSVQFTDQSTGNPDTWSWNFGDGNMSNSQHPNYTYTSVGNYTVTLTVSNSAGSDLETKTNYIQTAVPVFANFTHDALGKWAPATVNFTDGSPNNPTSWHWDFGDGGMSNQQNPSHYYSQGGDYAVTLTAGNAISQDDETKIIHINRHVDPDFSSDVTSGEAPLTVQFFDQSGGGPTSWAWYYGDGGNDWGNIPNPVHTYTSPGVYTVEMHGDNDDESVFIIKTDYITVTVGDQDTDGDSILDVDDNCPSVYNPGQEDFDGDGVGNLCEVVVPTSDWMNIFCGSVTNVDGSTATGTIRAFDPNGTLCGMYTISNGMYGLMPVYRDDPITPEDEGALPGDLIVFTIDGVLVSTISPVAWSSGSNLEVCDFILNGTGSCCGEFTGGQTGNIDCDLGGKRNLADITRLIDNVYITKSPLCCQANGNVDGDIEAKVNLADITRLIDHVYISKGETAVCE